MKTNRKTKLDPFYGRFQFIFNRKQPVPVAVGTRGAVGLEEAERQTGWNREALIALHEVVFPHQPYDRTAEFTFDTLIEAENRGDHTASLHFSLFHYLVDLWRTIKTNYPAKSVVSKTFEHVLYGRDEQIAPAMKDLETLLQFFMALPAEERTRVLNGWTAPKAPPDRKAWESDIWNQHLAHCLYMNSASDGQLCYMPTSSTNPVQVMILQGTTRKEAIAELERVTDFLRLHFDDLISGNEEFFTAGICVKDAAIERQRLDLLNSITHAA